MQPPCIACGVRGLKNSIKRHDQKARCSLLIDLEMSAILMKDLIGFSGQLGTSFMLSVERDQGDVWLSCGQLVCSHLLWALSICGLILDLL